jgi:hypothetical protein
VYIRTTNVSFLRKLQGFSANCRGVYRQQPHRLPGPNGGLLSELGDFARNGFWSDRLDLAKTEEKLARQDAKTQRNPIRFLLTLCEKRIISRGSAALCPSVANPFFATW